jgi:hypothetical protein
VEVARRAFEAFNRTYAEGTPDLYGFLDPNVELVPMTALLTRTPITATTGHGNG